MTASFIVTLTHEMTMNEKFSIIGLTVVFLYSVN